MEGRFAIRGKQEPWMSWLMSRVIFSGFVDSHGLHRQKFGYIGIRENPNLGVESIWLGTNQLGGLHDQHLTSFHILQVHPNLSGDPITKPQIRGSNLLILLSVGAGEYENKHSPQMHILFPPCSLASQTFLFAEEHWLGCEYAHEQQNCKHGMGKQNAVRHLWDEKLHYEMQPWWGTGE